MDDTARGSGKGTEDMTLTARNIPLVGLFENSKFIYVYGQSSQEKLRLLGSYGTEIQKSSRKEQNRMGPLDRQIIDTTVIRTNVDTTVLTMHEAFFLNHALRRLSILTPSSGDPLGLESCWNLFRNYYKNVCSSIDFAVQYAVYYYFQSRGWIVKEGTNFGVDFLLYANSPSMEHSQFAVYICYDHSTRSSSNRWATLLTLHRVLQSAGKELVLAYVSATDTTELAFKLPNCIQSMSIVTRSFKANASVPAKLGRSEPSIKHAI